MRRGNGREQENTTENDLRADGTTHGRGGNYIKEKKKKQSKKINTAHWRKEEGANRGVPSIT